MRAPYRVGEVVLLEWHGWLKAFRVLEARMIDEEHIEYQMGMVEMEPGAPPAWKKPA